MKRKLYRFHVTYEVFEDVLWREIEVPSDMRLDRLAYIVLTTFDTLAYRKFRFELGEVEFMELPYYDAHDDTLPDPREYLLSDLKLRRNSKLYLVYCLEGEATFTLRFMSSEDKECTEPRISDGCGKGIIDDITVSEFECKTREILDTGSTEALYLSLESKDYEPWNIKDFNIEENRRFVEKYAPLIERQYAVKEVYIPKIERPEPVIGGPPYGSRVSAYLGITAERKGYRSIVKKKKDK